MADVDKLEGRELDAAVAERILGWRWRAFQDRDGWQKDIYPPLAPELKWPPPDGPPLDGLPYENSLHYRRDLPRFHDDDANAWPAVLDAMEARGWDYIIESSLVSPGMVNVYFTKPGINPRYKFRASANTRAEAVARAALRALAAEEEGA